MNLLLYLENQYKEYNSETYRVLLHNFTNIYNKLTTLYTNIYIPLYQKCKSTANTEFFEKEGFGYPIFRFKQDFPCSNVFYDINNYILVSKDADIDKFYEDILIDLDMIEEMNIKINEPHFQKIYEKTDIISYTERFYEDIAQIYKDTLTTEFVNAVEDIKSIKAIKVEGTVE